MPRPRLEKASHPGNPIRRAAPASHRALSEGHLLYRRWRRLTISSTRRRARFGGSAPGGSGRPMAALDALAGTEKR